MSAGGPRFPTRRRGEAGHAILPGRAVVACMALAAQLWVGACASVGPVSPSKRDLVSVAFAEPRQVRSKPGDTFLLRSLIGDVERLAGDTVFLRIADATEVEGRRTDPLLGLRVTVLRSEARLTVVDADTSGVIVATTLLATLGAFLAGALLGVFGLDYE